VLNKLASLSAEEKARGVIGISAGNHAQALAYGAALEGVDALIVMWQGVSEQKLEATRAYGGTVDLEATDPLTAFDRLDVLVAETNMPPGPEQRGVRAWVMKLAMKWAGADVPSPNRIVLLRDADGGGVAEIKSTFLAGLNSPVGIALIGSDLYVADTYPVLPFPFRGPLLSRTGKLLGLAILDTVA